MHITQFSNKDHVIIRSLSYLRVWLEVALYPVPPTPNFTESLGTKLGWVGTT